MTKPVVKRNKFKKACTERDQIEARVTALEAELEKYKRLDREAATHVETVICMRSKHFTGEPPYVGWSGLGLALRQDYDRLAALEAREKRVRELCAKLEAGVEWPMARKILAILDGDTE